MHSFRCHDLLLDYKEANVTLICKSWTCEIVHGISLGIWKAHRKIRKKKEREKREKERKKNKTSLRTDGEILSTILYINTASEDFFSKLN